MKRFLSVLFLLVIACSLYAQEKEVTMFLGIPVDGTKTAMIRKLEAKGFKYNSQYDFLGGQFNGNDVHIFIGTNNNKVYRIGVFDSVERDETDIKIRFNNLCQQFSQNPRYFSAKSKEGFLIPESEDISYEINVKNKRYQATFFQSDTTIYEKATRHIFEKHPIAELEKLSEDERIELIGQEVFEITKKRQVWFMISERYGKYSICLFYDNLYNQANGEDL